MAGAEFLMEMTREEMLADYLRRSGDTELAAGELVLNGHGFVVYRVRDGVFKIVQCYGDGRYWGVEAQRLARFYRCPVIRVYTRRNPAVFMRRWPGLAVAWTCLEGRLPDAETTGITLEVDRG